MIFDEQISGVKHFVNKETRGTGGAQFSIFPTDQKQGKVPKEIDRTNLL